MDSGSRSATGSAQVYESHFLPAEETTPDELQHFIQRALRAESEYPYDGEQAMLFDYQSHDAWLRLNQQLDEDAMVLPLRVPAPGEPGSSCGPDDVPDLEVIVKRSQHDS